jgi:hypothetical protein
MFVERNHDMAYMDLIRKLEKRFGFRELPETAQVQFNNAGQTPEELLEDWVDRVLSLATRALVPLPSFSPDSSQPLLRRPLLLPRGEALEIPASLPFEDCAQI